MQRESTQNHDHLHRNRKAFTNLPAPHDKGPEETGRGTTAQPNEGCVRQSNSSQEYQNLFIQNQQQDVSVHRLSTYSYTIES